MSTKTKLSAEEYREMIEHLADYWHLIYHGDPERMNAAIGRARALPDLLEACKAAEAELSEWDCMIRPMCPPGMGPRTADALATVRAAIRKAEGGPE